MYLRSPQKSEPHFFSDVAFTTAFVTATRFIAPRWAYLTTWSLIPAMYMDASPPSISSDVQD